MLLYLSFVICLAAGSYNYKLDSDSSLYNYFDFVRQWGPNLCYKASHACLPIPANLTYWTIHGLWPSLTSTKYPSNCETCHFNVSELDPIKSELESQWMTDYSGGDEKFWSHEYCKHGTCCTDLLPKELDFFKKALELHQRYKIDVVLENSGITPSTQKSYSLQDVYDVLENSFGKPTFWCRFIKEDGETKQLLFQVSICIDKDFDIVGCPESPHSSCSFDQNVFFIPNKS